MIHQILENKLNYLKNPNKGSIAGDWYLNVIHVPEFGTIQFLAESCYFFTNTPCLIGKATNIAQVCAVCKKVFDEDLSIFVVHRIKQGIEWQSVCRISVPLDDQDVMCSKEKFPKFLEWQMSEHLKQHENSTTTPT